MYPTAAQSPVARRSGSSGLAELLEVILDRGLVIDAFVRVSLVGIELITIDARIVVASVDTYLHFAEAVNRLDLRESSDAMTIQDLDDMGGDMAHEATDGAMNSLKDKLPLMSADGEGDEQEQREKQEA